MPDNTIKERMKRLTDKYRKWGWVQKRTWIPPSRVAEFDELVAKWREEDRKARSLG